MLFFFADKALMEENRFNFFVALYSRIVNYRFDY